jgi:hypothetical protein
VTDRRELAHAVGVAWRARLASVPVARRRREWSETEACSEIQQDLRAVQAAGECLPPKGCAGDNPPPWKRGECE